jgi:multimeric flavodoxin WrbA
VYKISEVKKRKTISILLDFFFTRKSRLSSADINMKEYDSIVFAAPIWGGKIASPMRAFIEKEKKNVNKYFFITLCNGENGQKEKIDAELYSILQQKPIEVKELWINSLLPEDKQNKIKYTFNYSINKNDLERFTSDFEAFIALINDVSDVG